MAKALVLYHSQQFGNTEAMAEAVAEGLKSGGLEVIKFNTNDDRFDVSIFPKFSCVAFGSPDYFSYIAGGLKTFLDDHYIEKGKGTKGMTGKPYALFYSHGGGGRVRSVMMDLFKGMGTLVGEPLGSNGKPSTNVIERCKKLGNDLAVVAK